MTSVFNKTQLASQTHQQKTSMPIIKILPHVEICPQGAELKANAGDSICEVLLDNGINIEHACDMSCPAPSIRGGASVQSAAMGMAGVNVDAGSRN